MDKKNKLPVGRPTKYRPEMCERIIELMREGASQNEVAADLGISHDTIAEWKKSIPEFSESINIGTRLSEAWWERHGRKQLENRDFNSTLWYMNMKNRFGWRDKSENTQKIEMSQLFGLPAVKPAGDK